MLHVSEKRTTSVTFTPTLIHEIRDLPGIRQSRPGGDAVRTVERSRRENVRIVGEEIMMSCYYVNDAFFQHTVHASTPSLLAAPLSTSSGSKFQMKLRTVDYGRTETSKYPT